MLLLTKLNGHRSNFHYSGFPNHPQTKSSLNIFICQSKLKRKCLPRDTLYCIMSHQSTQNMTNDFHQIYKGLTKLFTGACVLNFRTIYVILRKSDKNRSSYFGWLNMLISQRITCVCDCHNCPSNQILNCHNAEDNFDELIQC